MQTVISEWQHEKLYWVSIHPTVLEFGSQQTMIEIPAMHVIDAWSELESLKKQVATSENGATHQNMPFSWRVVDGPYHSTELQVTIGEQPIDTTIGNRQNWKVTQRHPMRTVERTPPTSFV